MSVTTNESSAKYANRTGSGPIKTFSTRNLSLGLFTLLLLAFIAVVILQMYEMMGTQA